MLNTYKNSPITANDAVKMARLVESNQALLGAAGHYSDTEQYELACLFEEQAEKALESYLDLASKIARLADAADEKCANVTIPTIPDEVSEIAKKYGVHVYLYHVIDTPFINAQFNFTIDYIDAYGFRYTALVRLGEVPVEFGDDIISAMFCAAFDACTEASLFDIMSGWMLPSTLRVCETGWKNCCAPASLTLDDAHALAKRAIDHFELFIDELEELTVD